jgi:hypothetical protein
MMMFRTLSVCIYEANEVGQKRKTRKLTFVCVRPNESLTVRKFGE